MTEQDPFEQLEARRGEIDKIRQALTSPAWVDTILPFLEREKLIKANELVAATCIDKPEPLRVIALGNRVATLEWVRTALLSKVREFDMEYAHEAERVRTQDQEREAGESLLEQGRSNRFELPPEGYTGE